MAFILCDAKAFSISSATENSIAPASNLNQDYPGMVWRSPDLVSVQVTAQITESPTVWDTICLYGTNLLSTDTVRVRAATSAANTTASPSYDSGTLPAFSTVANATKNMFLLTLSSNRTERFVRFDITSTASAGYVQAERLIIGKRAETGGVDIGAECTIEGNSDINTYRGVLTTTPYSPKNSWKVSATGMSEAAYYGSWYPLLRRAADSGTVLMVPDTLSQYVQNEAVCGLITGSAKGTGLSTDFFKLELGVRER